MKPLALQIDVDNETQKPRIRSISTVALFGRSEATSSWRRLLAEWKGRRIEPGAGNSMIADVHPHPQELKTACEEILASAGLAGAVADLDAPISEGGLLICRGSGFHVDSMYFPENVFLTHYLDGPPMEFLIPHAGVKRVISPGDSFVFDPAAPHALFEPGKGLLDLCAATPVSTFISIDIPLTPLIEQRLGIRRFDHAPVGHLLMDSTSAINKETGAYALDAHGHVMNHAELVFAEEAQSRDRSQQ